MPQLFALLAIVVLAGHHGATAGGWYGAAPVRFEVDRLGSHGMTARRALLHKAAAAGRWHWNEPLTLRGAGDIGDEAMTEFAQPPKKVGSDDRALGEMPADGSDVTCGDVKQTASFTPMDEGSTNIQSVASTTNAATLPMRQSRSYSAMLEKERAFEAPTAALQVRHARASRM